MYLRYGIIADAVTSGGGSKKNIIGTFDVIYSGSFPAKHLRLALALRIEGHSTEAGEHRLDLSLVDADGSSLGGPSPLVFRMQQEGRSVPDAPLAVELVFTIDDLVFPKPENYEFAVRVDARYIGGIPLYVRPVPKTSGN